MPVLKEITDYLGKEIKEMTINKNDYRETIVFSEETPTDNWRLLLEQDEKAQKKFDKKKKKK
jgi:ATP-dependent RNA helicase RhlE